LVQFGILLPMDSESVELSQSMFNGIRIAVDEHNASGGGQMPIKMIFRDSGHRPELAAEATEELVRENVDVIIGPIYSDEARAAAGVAQVNGVPMIAPLATDENVSKNRPYVFQANPTIGMRGRLMARFAVRSLRLDEFGIVSEFNNELSEVMAESFEDELFRLGAEVAFVKLLPGPSSWFRLLDHVKPDTLIFARALYLPISGGDAPTLIRAALNELERADVPMRVLGNKEWHVVGAARTASKYNTTYTNDFYVDESLPATRSFIASFAALSDKPPTQLSYSGYDVARYVMLQLTAHAGQPLHRAFREAPPYQGLGTRLDFRGGNVNEAIFFLRYRDGFIELLR
ncbi:MAG: ABC transporter substrate-binding protein, partial [Rhodothermales bacterium]|nr:ABC transporter substrate-binding protein [Rhodothermales bacterium]